jgi:hypothetical protein
VIAVGRGRIIALAALMAMSLTLLPAGCSDPIGAGPGEGPAETATEPSGPVEDGPGTRPTDVGEGEPGDDPADGPTATFDQKFVYPDGIEVEFTEIRSGEVTAEDAEFDSAVEIGDDYVAFTLQVRNGTPLRMDVVSLFEVTYGPGDDLAEEWLNGDEYDGRPDGLLLPGKAKSGQAAYLIPAEFHDDVVAVVTVEIEHSPVVFTGAIG